MASYLNIALNHFAAMQRWVAGNEAEATLDMSNLSVEVKCRGRYYRMYPTFQAIVHGRLSHLPNLTADARGFGGWRPYQGVTHPHSSDKALFKTYLAEAGLRSPASWDVQRATPDNDYVLKARRGSFGEGLHGPYRANARVPEGIANARDGGFFAEQFVQGRMLKVWYWGARPFFAHMQEFPAIAGDGRSTVEDLLRARIAAAQLSWGTLAQKPVVMACLAFQGIGLHDVLEEGRLAWFDYRYGQLYPTSFGATPLSDNKIDPLAQLTGTQLQDQGRALARLLQQAFPAPVLITVDGILDREGRIWWLEMNTNSLVPPEAYEVMFADLFG